MIDRFKSSGHPQLKRLMKKAIESPEKIPAFLNNTFNSLKYRILYYKVKNQKELIHNFIGQNSFALIILDSCRIDYFKNEMDDYLAGELDCIYTPATATIEYTQSTWDDYYDLNYVTAIPAPTDYAFKRKGLDYRPTEHISNFVHVWQNSDSKELGAVTPEEVTDRALQKGGERMVVHYAQPHAPYIGETRLRGDEDSIEWEESLQDIYEKIGRYERQRKTISDEELRRAYRSNLKRVLASVKDLVAHLDRPVVITADHGELLGEDGRYIHGGKQHPHLCEVPWFTVDDSMMGKFEKDIEDQTPDEEVSKKAVEEQLKNLGYI